MCSFVSFCSLCGISKIVIEALKFAENFVLIMYPQNRGTKTDLEYLLLLSHFSAAHRLDVLSQLVRYPDICCSVSVRVLSQKTVNAN